jgi:hypothetical protein
MYDSGVHMGRDAGAVLSWPAGTFSNACKDNRQCLVGLVLSAALQLSDGGALTCVIAVTAWSDACHPQTSSGLVCSNACSTGAHNMLPACSCVAQLHACAFHLPGDVKC